jgi:hypothetical protein
MVSFDPNFFSEVEQSEWTPMKMNSAKFDRLARSRNAEPSDILFNEAFVTFMRAKLPVATKTRRPGQSWSQIRQPVM